MSISFLPDATVQHLRSSVNITSLAQCVSELAQNSLDAGATSINITVSLLRSSVTVADNGRGIRPEDMDKIGQRYATSKLRGFNDLSSISSFGFRGEALASIAAISLLTITSRHTTYRSTHTVRLKSSSRIFSGRASENESLKGQGTVVSVHDLFSTLPVRRKARRLAGVDDLGEVRRVVVGLALAKPDITFTLRDETGAKILSLKRKRKEDDEMTILRQAYGRDFVSDWQNIEASEGGVSMRGVVGLNGHGSKQHQYIYLNDRLLQPCDLHRTLSKLFANSSFAAHGTDGDDDGERDFDAPNVRKSPRKNVDRHPVYVIKITCALSAYDVCLDPSKSVVETERLPQISTLLASTVKGFLASHNLVSGGKEKETMGEVDEDVDPFRIPQKRGGFSKLPELERPSKIRAARMDDAELRGRTLLKPSINKTNAVEVVAHPIGSAIINCNGDNDTTEGEGQNMGMELVDWVDPMTNKNYLLDTRTGNTYTSRPGTARPLSSRLTTSTSRSLTASSVIPTFVTGVKVDRSSLRRTGGSAGRGFAETLVARWQNPVFGNTELAIPQLSSAAVVEIQSSQVKISRYFSANTSSSKNGFRLTKKALANCVVVAQVDRKFILVKMKTENGIEVEGEDVLVIIDQHAADERVRVERFFTELCQLDSDREGVRRARLDKRVVVTLSGREGRVLGVWRERLAWWGVIFEDKGVTEGEGHVEVVCTHLPPLIAERCVAEPRLLHDLVRDYLYSLESSGRSLRPPPTSTTTSTDSDWLTRIRTCPPKMIEMINSRACRSAIMFNDPLTTEECRVLVEALAGCAFPFQCAHGRPSMVPLVDLSVKPGTEGKLQVGKDMGEGGRKKGMFDQWKRTKATTAAGKDKDKDKDGCGGCCDGG
ncbi:DNA mismatch repair protein [Saitoella coloradoensis]